MANHPAPTDRTIQAAVESELRWTPDVEAAHIATSMQDHAVTLTGEFCSYPERLAARRASLRVKGVSQVANSRPIRNRSWKGTSERVLFGSPPNAVGIRVIKPVPRTHPRKTQTRNSFESCTWPALTRFRLSAHPESAASPLGSALRAARARDTRTVLILDVACLFSYLPWLMCPVGDPGTGAVIPGARPWESTTVDS